MKWYYILLLVSVVIAPFDALYVYIRSERRRDALKKRKQKNQGNEDHSEKG